MLNFSFYSVFGEQFWPRDFVVNIKDAGAETVFSQYLSNIRTIAERVETQRKIARQHDKLIDQDDHLASLKIAD